MTFWKVLCGPWGYLCAARSAEEAVGAAMLYEAEEAILARNRIGSASFFAVLRVAQHEKLSFLR